MFSLYIPNNTICQRKLESPVLQHYSFDKRSSADGLEVTSVVGDGQKRFQNLRHLNLEGIWIEIQQSFPTTHLVPSFHVSSKV
jgi:glutamine cyclotransferase